jgi:DNA-binding transcriptional regulator YhcF (GntR family)
MDSRTTKLPAAEHAYRSIRSAIISGELEEGERLIEEKVSADLGLSRTPVREAIRRLTLEGFIERHGGYNTRVASFPEDEVEQTFHIRQMLESYAAERAARLATDEEIAQLRALSDQISRHTPPQTSDDYQKFPRPMKPFTGDRGYRQIAAPDRDDVHGLRCGHGGAHLSALHRGGVGAQRQPPPGNHRRDCGPFPRMGGCCHAHPYPRRAGGRRQILQSAGRSRVARAWLPFPDA